MSFTCHYLHLDNLCDEYIDELDRSGFIHYTDHPLKVMIDKGFETFKNKLGKGDYVKVEYTNDAGRKYAFTLLD